MEGAEMEAATVRTQIIEAFPPVPFRGVITPADNEPWAEEIDDDLDLRDRLYGQAWTSVPAEFIDRHFADLELMELKAFAAFVPAWLTRGLDLLDRENLVREFAVRAFCPVPSAGEVEARVLNRLVLARIRALNRSQTAVVRAFLQFVVTTERSARIRDEARKALLNIQSEA